MPYIYRVSRRTFEQPRAAVVVKPALEPVEEGPSYRDLQAQAKELGISGKQTADDLKKAIEEANDG